MEVSRGFPLLFDTHNFSSGLSVVGHDWYLHRVSDFAYVGAIGILTILRAAATSTSSTLVLMAFDVDLTRFPLPMALHEHSDFSKCSSLRGSEAIVCMTPRARL